MSPFDWWDDALELGVVDIVDNGEPGFISFGVVLPVNEPFPLFSCLIPSGDVVLLFVTFCCASRSCFLNFALRFWNQTCHSINVRNKVNKTSILDK